ncbi:MAG TPA: cytochrome c [Polyangiaceae bacterium]|nr:cytochrome c [Polyangiaceae bacterium]
MTACRALALASLALALGGCENPVTAIGFERMLDQPRGKPFKASPYFADGRLMRTPPAGAVPIDGAGSRERTLGLSDNAYVTTLPLAVDRELLQRGRDRFDVYCAACHGATGDGTSIVATHMSLRKPPSLVDEPVRSFPPGRVFQVITDGYGLMPSYAPALAVDERWAVVAYLRALTLAAHVELGRLPAAVQSRAAEALR